MAQHKHADLMAMYAEDAYRTDKPWKYWEYQDVSRSGIHKEWIACRGEINWDPETQYRRTQKRVSMMVNNSHIEMYEPLKEKPKLQTSYYFYCVIRGSVIHGVWHGSDADKNLFKNRMIHLSREAAEKHGESLRRFNSM